MAQVYRAIEDRMAAFIRRQRVFFVATASLSAEGHLNLSPKGLDTFAIVDPKTVAYLDLTGSGIETVAHLRENGRVVIMFCAFEGSPKIVRLHGRGEVVEPADPAFETLRVLFPPHQGVRSVIRVALSRISDSCGFGVPLYRFERDRSQLVDYYENKGSEAMAMYRAEENRHSIDGLPGLRSATSPPGPAALP